LYDLTSEVGPSFSGPTFSIACNWFYFLSTLIVQVKSVVPRVQLLMLVMEQTMFSAGLISSAIASNVQ